MAEIKSLIQDTPIPESDIQTSGSIEHLINFRGFQKIMGDCSRQYFYDHRDEIPHYSTGKIMFRASELERWIQSKQRGPKR